MDFNYLDLNTQNVKQPDANPYHRKPQTFTRDPALYLSPLGTPVMQDLTFGAVIYTEPITGITRTTAELKLVNILLRATQAKKIVKTEIPGRNGTVKEYIGIGDWEVEIDGFIAGPNGHHPADEIIALKNVLKANEPIPVTCTWLNNLEIHYLVIVDYTFPQEAGGYSKQPFTISAISNPEITITIL